MPPECTKQSGRHSVQFKTRFPPVLGLFLNRRTMLPFHGLQKLFSGSDRALVLYFQCTPPREGAA
jgi:hypothetical protein